MLFVALGEGLALLLALGVYAISRRCALCGLCGELGAKKRMRLYCNDCQSIWLHKHCWRLMDPEEK